MADLIPRFYDVTKGHVRVGGIDVRQLNVQELRSIMGNVNQEAILFNDTIYNNIAFGVEGATLEQVRAAARIANADDFIMATEDGYHTRVGDRGCRLSGGQRQRIGIARALYKQADVLLFDEATSSLDSRTEEEVNRSIEALSAENRELTIIVIAHRDSSLEYCDRIITTEE